MLPEAQRMNFFQQLSLEINQRNNILFLKGKNFKMMTVYQRYQIKRLPWDVHILSWTNHIYNHIRIILDCIRLKRKYDLCPIKSDYINVGGTKLNLVR